MQLTILRVQNLPRHNFNEELVFNAPRPILGNYEWRDEFRHGVYYCTVAPKMMNAWGLIANIIDMGGWLLQNVDQTAIDQWGRQFCAKHGIDFEDANPKSVQSSFFHNVGQTTVEVNSLEGVIRAFQAPIE